jgi:hypothetical protein
MRAALCLFVLGLAAAIPVAFESSAFAQGGVASGPGGIVQVTAPAQTVLPEGTGAISGLVTDALSGAPLPDAVVTISVGSPRTSVARTTREVTDGRGRFLFTKLPANDDYHLVASAPGYFDARYGQPSLRDGNAPIALADGQWFSKANIALWKGGAISGTVTDERGDPVVGVYVHVLFETLVSGAKQLASGPLTTTDDRGAYRIAGLGPGTYLVAVPSAAATVPAVGKAIIGQATPFAVFDADAGARLALGKYPIPPPPHDGHRWAYPPLYAPSALSPADATAVTLNSGDSRLAVDITLTPTLAVTIAGRVEAPEEALSALSLRLVPAAFDGLGQGSETATALVGADGAFTFLNVPSGAYIIDARPSTLEYVYNINGAAPRLPQAPGLNSYSSTVNTIEGAAPGVQYGSTTAGPGAPFWARVPVTVGMTDMTGLVLTLKHGVTISGRITRESKDPSNAPPLTRFYGPRAEPANGSLATGMARSNQLPDDPSDLELPGIVPGQYVLRFNQPPGTLVKSIRSNGDDLTYRPIDLSDGRDIMNVQVTFTDDLPTVNGAVRVTDNAIKQVTVLTFPVEADQWSNYGLTPVRIKRTSPNAQGQFHLTSLPEGDYYAIALPTSEADGWSDPSFLKRAAQIATRISLKWGQTTSVDLTATHIR